jgi:signal transduction histidine kinase
MPFPNLLYPNSGLSLKLMMHDALEVEQLRKRLERERRARAESEEIAEKALSQQYLWQKEMSLLQLIATAANESLVVDHAVQTALDQVCVFTGWPVGHAYLLAEDNSEELVPTKLWHVPDAEHFETFRQVTEATHFKEGVGLPGRVFGNRKPVWIIDVTKDSNFPRAKAADEIGVRAAFGFPVLIGADVVAVLEFFSDVPREPDDRLLSVMAHVGTLLGRVIERKRSQEAIVEKNARLEQALSENLCLYEDLKLKKAELEAASKHKSQFLANMSHELRTPLNAIIGYTELILNNIYGDVPDKIKEILHHVESSGRHLLGLINDILDLSKIEAGHLKLSLNEYSMHEVVHSVITAVESLASQKGLVLVTSVPPDLKRGKGDERRINQVLLNLVGNAIKFTEVGEVRIQVAQSDCDFRVTVSDTGPGIPHTDQNRIFDEFQQADSSNTRKKGGTGLGLSIVKRIVMLHGGKVGINSEPGHGASFWFMLPICAERQEMI